MARPCAQRQNLWRLLALHELEDAGHQIAHQFFLGDLVIPVAVGRPLERSREGIAEGSALLAPDAHFGHRTGILGAADEGDVVERIRRCVAFSGGGRTSSSSLMGGMVTKR